MARRTNLQEEIEKEISSRGLNLDYESRSLWPEPYCQDSYESCRAFAYLCKTFNEADRQSADPILEKQYLDWATWHWYDTRAKGQPIVTWKSRRMVYSWWNRALELWDAGLKVASTQIAAKTYEGDAGSKAFIWRTWFIYNQLRKDHPDWHLPKPAYTGNPLKYVLENLILANGSKFESINSEKESFRGTGATRAVSEELSSYQNVESVWGQQNIVCKGKPGSTGGHAVGIANTSNNEQWKTLKAKAFDYDPSWPECPPGCEAWESPKGVRVLKIHYKCDPEKDAAWVEKERVGIPDEEWAREMELDEDVEEGLPVFPSYDDDYHCIVRFRTERIPICSGSFWIAGWDCGQTLIPAFFLMQVTPQQKQAQGMLEVISTGNESMAQFAPRVKEALLRFFPNIMDQIYHCGDATVSTKSGTNGRSARDEAKRWGFNIHPLPNDFEFRRSAGNWLLERVIDEEKPGFLLDGSMCPIARAALKGKFKYVFSQADSGKEQEGKSILQPRKNMYSHIGDAYGYAAGQARKLIEGKMSRPGPRSTVRTVTRRKMTRDLVDIHEQLRTDR